MTTEFLDRFIWFPGGIGQGIVLVALDLFGLFDGGIGHFEMG